METVKVDIQKLQLLNDRLAQTIDALNQVRMSVHGIQHSGGQVAPWGYSPYSTYPTTQSYGFAPAFSPYAQPFVSPYAQTPYGSPMFSGIQHSSVPFASPFATSPFATNPYATSPFATSPFATSPYATSPYAMSAVQTPFGIQHTSSPYGIQHSASPIASQLGSWTMPYVGNGISHSSAFDPQWQLRAMQAAGW